MPPELLFPALGLLLVVLGWPMATRRVRPNRWYGLRVPATFADEHVWYEANAAAGRDMMALGAVLVLVALVLPRLTGLPDSTYAGVCAGILGLGSLVLAVRGWRMANRLLQERRGSAGPA
jgi:uncharacterized membrane protein